MVTDKEIVNLYTIGHFTMRQIAALDGRSPAMVLKVLKRNGISGKDGVMVEVTCDFCGGTFSLPRSKARMGDKKYCNQEHYWAGKQKESKYKPWERGNSRIMRAIMSQVVNLNKENWVAPLDGKMGNVDMANLGVFENEQQWIAWTLGDKKVKMVWPPSA